MEKADLLGDAVEAADEIGDDAIKAVIVGMELLVLLGVDEEYSCRGRNIGLRLQEAAGARIGQVEVQP